MIDVTEIEKRVDRAIAQPIPVDAEMGGLSLETLGQVMEFAKLMAVSGAAVPKYLRGNPGACLAITTRALRWKMDPFAVAEKSYMVVNRGEERVAFEAQLVHAVVTARAPLQNRLRHEIVGEGDERRCKVSGLFRGEKEPHVYVSETLGRLREARGRNPETNVLRGSPLWETQPEVQLTYSAVRQWARLFASETLLGVYTPDELDGEEPPPDTTASPLTALGQRLRDAKLAQARGFDAAHVARESGAVIEGEINKETSDATAQGSDGQPEDRGGPGDAGGEPVRDHDEAGRAGAGGTDQQHGERPAGEEPAHPQASGPAAPEQPAAKPKKGKRGG